MKNMKRTALYLFAAAVALGASGCSTLKNVDAGRVLSAGATAAQAASITDADIVEMSRQAMVVNDSENKIAPSTSPYAQRLAKLTNGLTGYDGLKLNFKVYITNDVNAFASGDGSVRVYSGLMDVMDDNELMAIVGHEIGHVKNQDTKDAVKNAYLSAAAREAVGAVGGTVGMLSDSMLGDIALSLTSAKYSRTQETAADEYGFQFTVKNGFDPYAMANSMKKLQEISGGSGSTLGLAQAFSSHPDTAAREKKMREKADAYLKK